MNTQTKRDKEKKLVSQMILLYCRKKHHSHTLCKECEALDTYAKQRSQACPFMESKTFCSNCTVHCYNKDMREKIGVVMRFSGPRMLFCHPFTALRHIILSRKEKRSLSKKI